MTCGVTGGVVVEAGVCPTADNCIYLNTIPDNGFSFKWLTTNTRYNLPYGRAVFGPCPTMEPPSLFEIASPWYEETRATTAPPGESGPGMVALYLNSSVTPGRDLGSWWQLGSNVVETVLPTASQRAATNGTTRRFVFYNFGVVDSDVMIPAANLSFEIKGGFRCSWTQIVLQPGPGAYASPAALGTAEVEVAAGHVMASQDGAWCLPEIRAVVNGVPLPASLNVADMTQRNGTGFIAVLGGIGEAPLEVRAYNLNQCVDDFDPETDWSGVVLGTIFAWSITLCVIFTAVVVVYSRAERLRIADETRHMSRVQRQHSLHARRRSFKERMMLSPLQKFARHKKFPWKLLIHLQTVLFALAYIFLHNFQFSSFVAANEASFRTVLGMETGLDTTALDFTAIYSVPDLVKTQDTALSNYFAYPLTSIGEVTVDEVVSIRMFFWNGTDATRQLTSESGGGPFSHLTQLEARELADSLERMTIHFIFNNKLSATPEYQVYQPFVTVRFKWDVEAIWDFTDDAQAAYKMRVRAIVQSGPVTALVTISVVLMCLCIGGIVLNIKALRKSYRVYRQARKRLENADNVYTHATLTWDAVSVMDKLAFFNLWHFWNMVSDVCLIIASLLVLSPAIDPNSPYSVDQIHRELSAEQLTRCLGTFITLFSTVKYMEHYPEFYLLVVAVRGSITRVLKFICMVMPFYMGYVVVGVFSFPTHVQLFGTVWQSSRTLFALLHGDSVLELYQIMCRDGDYAYCAFAQVYLYSFCIIFIVVILNVFIFIIETGYEKAQRSTGAHDERPLMLDHDRLHRVLDAAEKAVVRDNDDDMFIDTGGGTTPLYETELEEFNVGPAESSPTESRAPSPPAAGIALGDADPSINGDAHDAPPLAATEESIRVDDIIRAAVEECTRKVLATRNRASARGVLRRDSMDTEGTEALLAENHALRDELTASEKVVTLLKRDLETLTTAVTNLRRHNEHQHAVATGWQRTTTH